MSSFEAFVNLELPKRRALLQATDSNVSYDGDPNDVGAPAILQGAPVGSWYFQASADVYWRRDTTNWKQEASGGGGGAVDSVNGQTGVVVLDSTDVGADSTGTGAAEAANAVSTHEAAGDPHPQYTTAAEAGAAAPVQSVNTQTGAVVLGAADVSADPAGTGATEAAGAVSTHESTFDHANLPNADEKAALVGTNGTPSAVNPYVTDSDPRIGTAPVDSVNGQTGVVVLDSTDVGADPAGTGATEAASAISAHETNFAHANLPTTDEKAALAGTNGAPSDTNRYVTQQHPRILPGIVVDTPTGITATIDWAAGGLVHSLDLETALGSVTLTLQNPEIGNTYLLKVIQGSSPRNLIWPTDVLWESGLIPTITVTPDAIDLIALTYDGTQYLARYFPNFALTPVFVPAPIFDFNPTGGIDEVGTGLTINAQTVAPTGFYRGDDATTSGWVAVAGPSLSTVGVEDRIFARETPITNAQAWIGNTTAYFEGASSADLDITTGDVVVELFAQIQSANSEILNKIGTGGIGYRLFFNATDQLVFEFNDGGGAIQVISPDIGTVGDWAWFQFFVDRDGSAVGYANGIAGTPVVVSGSTGSLASDVEPHIGADRAGSNIPTRAVSSLAIWEQAAWLDTHLQPELAVDRLSQALGTFETVLGAGAPVFSRASSAYVQRYSLVDSGDKLYSVAQGWARTGLKSDGVNILPTVLIESQNENLAVDTDQFSTPNWQYNGGSASVVSSTENSPDESKKAFALIPNVGAGQSNVENFPSRFSITGTVPHAISFYVKVGTLGTQWASIRVIGPTGTTAAETFFDLSTGTVGAKGPDADTADLEQLANGWYRASITLTPNVTGDAHVQVAAASDDGDKVVSGNGVDPALFLFGFQFEEGTYASSYISSGSAATTKAADSALVYTGPSFDAPYTSNIEYLQPVAIIPGKVLSVLSDGGSPQERVVTDLGNSRPSVFGSSFSSPSGSISMGNTPGSEYTPGEFNTVTVATADDDSELFENTNTAGTDAAGFPPDNVDQINLGSDLAQSLFFDGWISRVRIYPDRLVQAQVDNL